MLTQSRNGLTQGVAGGFETKKVDYSNKQKKTKGIIRAYSALGLDVEMRPEKVDRHRQTERDWARGMATMPEGIRVR